MSPVPHDLCPIPTGTRGPSAAAAPQPLGQRQVQDGYGAGRTVLPRGLPGTCVNSSSTHTAATSTTTASGVHSGQLVGAAPGHATVPRHAKDGSGKDPVTGPGMPPPRLLTALPPLPSSPTTVSNTVAAARPPGMRPAGATMSLGGSMAPTVLAGSGAAAAARAVFLRCGPRGAPLLSCTVAGVKAQERQQAQTQHRGPQQVPPASSSRGWWPSADEWASARGGGRISAPQPAPQIRPLPGTRVLPAAEAGHAGRRPLPDRAPPSLTAAPLPPPPPPLLQPRPAAGPSVAGTAAAAQAVTAGWLLAGDGWGPLGSRGSRPAAAEDLSRRPTGGGLARLYEDHSLSSDDDVGAGDGDGGRGGYGGRQGGNGGGGRHGARGSGGGAGAGGNGRGGALLVDLTGSGGEEDGDGEEGEIPTGLSSVAMTATTTANGGSSSAQGLRAPDGSRGLSRHGGSGGGGGGGCDLADEFHRLRLCQPEAPRHHHPHYHHRSHSRNEHYRGLRDGHDPHHHHQHPQWHRNRDRSRDRSHDRWHVTARQGYGPPWGKAAESAVAAAAWAALHSRPRSPQRQTVSGKALACGPEAARGRSPQRRGGAPHQPPQPPPQQQQQQQQQHRPAQLSGLPPPVAKLQEPAAPKTMQGSQPQGTGPQAVMPAAATAALQRKTRRRRRAGGGGDGGRAADASGQAQGGGPVGVQVQDGRRRVVSMAAVLAAAAQVRQRRRSSIACGLDGPAAALRAAALVTRSRVSAA